MYKIEYVFRAPYPYWTVTLCFRNTEIVLDAEFESEEQATQNAEAMRNWAIATWVVTDG